MGIVWEQKDIDGLLWKQEEFDGNLMGTKGI
jgi:hypothetical protein